MKKTFILCSVLILALGLKVFPLELYITADRISLEAQNAPLRDILQAFADRGISVHADPKINPFISVSLKNREIEQGLKSLFKNLDHILVWKTIDTPAGQFVRLGEIHLFIRGKRDLSETFTPGTSRIARNSDDGSLFIKNEIIIRLSKDIDPEGFRNFLLDNGYTVTGYNKISGTLRIILPDNSDYPATLEFIQRYPGVRKAEPNYAYPVTKPLYASGEVLNRPAATSKTYSGKGAPIAVIDSGLKGKYHSEPYIYASFNCLDPEEPVSDSLGHGTQMAMIAAGAVKPAGVLKKQESLNPVIAIKGFDEEGYISNFDLINGIEFALNNGARVMSLSWGSETRSEFLEQALDYAASERMIILGAAGNEPTGKKMYPAAYNSVIGVGALDTHGERWDKSNSGDFVNIYAPGFASFPGEQNGEPGTYAGTSISTAFVASLMAGYLADNPKASIGEILKSLTSENSNHSENKE